MILLHAIIDLFMNLDAVGDSESRLLSSAINRLCTVAKTYVAYLKVHPEKSDYTAASVVWLMLQERFPTYRLVPLTRTLRVRVVA